MQPDPRPPQSRFRIGDAAALLGVSDDTVRRWVEAGRLPAERSASGPMEVEGTDLAALAQELAGDQQLPGSRRRPPVTGCAASSRGWCATP